MEMLTSIFFLNKAMTLINYVIYEDVKANGHCRMTASPELKAYKSRAYQIGLPHGSPFAATFNEYMHKTK